MHEVLRQKVVSIGLFGAGSSDTLESVPVAKFLNRLLGVEVGLQNALFAYYSAIFDHDILVAVRDNVAPSAFSFHPSLWRGSGSQLCIETGYAAVLSSVFPFHVQLTLRC